MKLNGFDKSMHLCSEKDIDLLYEKGKRVTCFPFRAVFRLRDDECGIKVMFVARKRSFRHAVDRNRWRRMMREAFRVRKSILEGLNIDIAVVVIEDRMVDSERVAAKMEELLNMIMKKAMSC